jgi:SSS family solute:Na+ symporter
MQLLVLAVGGFAYYLAIVQEQSLVWLLLTAYGVVDQFAPPIYAALFWRRATTTGALAGLVAGIATNVFFLRYVELRPFDMHEGILGVIVNTAVLIAVSLITRPQSPAHIEAFVENRHAPGAPTGATATGAGQPV